MDTGLGLAPGYLCSSSAAEGFINAATLHTLTQGRYAACMHVCVCVGMSVCMLPHLTVFICRRLNRIFSNAAIANAAAVAGQVRVLPEI